jgi:ribose transport system ATP-binding protein
VMEYPSVRALDGVSVSFEAGEVHGIVGENGAGKSTLMKILGGVQKPTAGEMLIDGAVVALAGVRHAQRLGIGMIHQELNLVDELSVTENVFLGREITRAGVLDRNAMHDQTENALRQIQAPYAADARVGDLSLAGKQLVEIARAISVQASILIMDEPTAVLSEPESKALFALIARLKERGVTILYISHRLVEVCGICDRITVLRDGAWIATLDGKSASPGQLADLMVGRPLNDFYPAKGAVPTGEPALEIRDAGGASLAVSRGEILGLAGLVGAGRTELAEAIVGVRARGMPAGQKPSAFELGEIRIDGVARRIRSPKEAMRNGIAYVSEDRKKLGLLVSLSVQRNVTLANLRAYGRVLVSAANERESAENWRRELDIRVAKLDEPAETLSGGNQQKVSVAKWLDTKPRVLILDEPTRGVDVGAKREMYYLIQRLAAEGMACIVISSDLPEIIGLCHRATVMRDGRIVGELDGDSLSEEAVMRLAAGVEAA